MQYAVVDIETTGNNIEVDDIIQIGVVFIDDFQIVKTYDTFVYTSQEITPFISSLTGIQQGDVEHAPTFKDIAAELFGMLDSCVFVAHNINFDLNFLKACFKKEQLSFNPAVCIDTVDLLKIAFPDQQSYQLGVISEALNINLANAHNALADAYATAELTILAARHLSSLPKPTLVTLFHLAKKMRYQLDHLFFSLIQSHRDLPHAFKEKDGLYYRHAQFRPSSIEIDGTLPDFYTQVIRTNELNYRKEQLFLAETIYHHLSLGRMKLIEAEVGSGKSLAYLIAAVYYQAETKENILISTATKALQQQLKDDAMKLEFTLSQQLPLMILKSKKNYLSLEFVKFIMDDQKENHDILLLKMQLLVYILGEGEGDIEQLHLNGGRQIYFDLMRNLYRSKQDTYLYLNVKTVQHPVIGITNHAHLLHSSSEGFPKYFQHLLVDEGHQLQEVALHQTYVEWTYQNIKYQIAQLLKDDSIAGAESGQKMTLATLYDWQASIAEIDQLNDQLFEELSKVDTAEYFHRFNHSSKAQVRQINALLEDLTAYLNSRFPKVLGTRQANYIQQFFALLNSALNKDKLVFYTMQNNNKSTLTLYIKDKKLNEIFSRRLLSHFQSITVLSGSLTIDQSLEHLKPLLGISDASLIKFDPIKREEKVTFFIPEDVPQFNYQSYETYIEHVVLYISAYLATGHQKMLVLFNSYQMIREVSDMLAEISDTVILSQTKQTNTHKLLTQFNQLDHGLLLGTQSFYEGLDYQSRDFKCVMIVTLPFLHPSDQRVLLMEDETNNSFEQYQLPYAATKMRQAAGRLIRHEDDDGIIICLDRRIVEASYHHIFDDVLKPYHVMRGQLNDLIAWIEKNKPIINK